MQSERLDRLKKQANTINKNKLDYNILKDELETKIKDFENVS